MKVPVTSCSATEKQKKGNIKEMFRIQKIHSWKNKKVPVSLVLVLRLIHSDTNHDERGKERKKGECKRWRTKGDRCVMAGFQ